MAYPSVPLLRQGDLTSEEEADFTRRLRDRSPAAWAVLYDAFFEKLYTYAFASLSSREDAEDVASTVFVRALQSIDRFNPRGKPIVAWLYGITKNVIKERQRSSRREHRSTSRDDAQDSDRVLSGLTNDPIDAAASAIDLKDALEKLSKDQLEVLQLVHIAGFSFKEVAAMTSRSERAVYYLEARAFTALRSQLHSH